MALPELGRIQTAEKRLDYRLFPDNTPEKAQRLIAGLQSIVYRLQSLEIAHGRIARSSLEIPEPFVRLGRQVREILQRVFERWASLGPDDEFQRHRDSLGQLSRDLQRQFDALESSRDQSLLSDQVLTDLYTTLGSVRGLTEAMADTQGVISQINWQQWAAVRF